MESQNPPQQSSLALLPKLKKVLRQRFTKRRDTAAQVPPQDQEAAQRIQQENEPAATHFHRFLDLPTELRLQIWSEATRYKRYVVLDPPANSAIAIARLARRTDKYAKPGYAGERRPAWTSRTPPPTLLSVSREAREVALGTWQLAFDLDVFPAAVYINFDQDDVVIGAGARVNKIGKHFVPSWLRPYSSLVDMMMMVVWTATPDVEKIQRIVACGDFSACRLPFRAAARKAALVKGYTVLLEAMANIQVFAQMRGVDTIGGPWGEFMPGLKSLTMVKVGDLRWHFFSGLYYEDYGTTRRSRKGSPLLSLDGIDFVKSKRAPIWTTQSFAEMEILDFVGGSPLSDIHSRWTMGPEASVWVVDRPPTRVKFGPKKQCVKRARWHCYTTSGTDIWYAI